MERLQYCFKVLCLLQLLEFVQMASLLQICSQFDFHAKFRLVLQPLLYTEKDMAARETTWRKQKGQLEAQVSYDTLLLQCLFQIYSEES